MFGGLAGRGDGEAKGLVGVKGYVSLVGIKKCVVFMLTEVTCPCLAHSFANVFLALMPVISEVCITCLPSSHARILLRLLPVSSFASCPLSLCSEARHHLSLTLVITPLSGSCLLMRCFQRDESRDFGG
ncbi:MAG: hypothetical protein IJV33_10490 [Bacteroidaceae bacterium]|nr:hypothetical protein [Bacteroidaceae bacterium]